MLNVYKVEENKSRVLLDIDVAMFFCLLMSFGEARPSEVITIIETYGFTPNEAKEIEKYVTAYSNTGSLYSETKQAAVSLMREYLNSKK